MDKLIMFFQRLEHLKKHADLLVAVGFFGILSVMMIPLPSQVLDLALSMSLTISFLILIVSIYTQKPLDFSIFPSLLLMTTLFRLSLNVASTRLILSEGHNGSTAAGSVIAAFGNFVVGGNYVIGLIVFSILVVINFIVITKGSGRVAEVAARFTLDAMPGKQMSIDADLNSGLITELEARQRRSEIEQEADFYGSMDGASKFVRGDAIAGIIITIINIIGGLLVGVLQKGLPISVAAENYTMLTIGDGLVSQIPALIISTAAGIVVTRNSSERNMGADFVGQLFMSPRAVGIVSVILIFLSLTPGMPTIPFLLSGLGLGGLSWLMLKKKKEEAQNEQREKEKEAMRPPKENIESLLSLDLIELEVGYGLISVVESEQSGDLVERIVSIRKQFALECGIMVPSIHIRDNLQLDSGEYRILIKGNKVAGGKLRSDCLLAMDPGNISKPIDGIATKEPAFGMDAVWISKKLKEEAEILGYTVVDLPTVMATHLTEVVRTHAHELLGRQEVSQLVENFKKDHPKLVEELIPDIMTLGGVANVLRNLLREQVSIRDLRTVFECLADEGVKSKDIEVLTENVRKALARSITMKYLDEERTISVLTLSSHIEDMISNSLLQTEQGVQLVMDPKIANEMVTNLATAIESDPEMIGQPVLLTSPLARRHIYKLISVFIPQLTVLSHNELTSDAKVSTRGTIEVANAS